MASDPSIRTSGPATFFMSATKQQKMIPTVYHPSHASAMAAQCAYPATFVAPIKCAPNVGAGSSIGRDFQRTRRSSAQHGGSGAVSGVRGQMLRLTRISIRYAAGRLCHRTVRVARSRVWVRAGVVRKEVTLAPTTKKRNAESPRFHRPMGFILVRNSSSASSRSRGASVPSRERSSTRGARRIATEPNGTAAR